MTTDQIQHIIQQGESKTVEFKTCKNKLNKDTFDSICAFLNRSGGYLLLGVKDNREITGVDEEAIQGILDTIVTSANNPQKLNPPYYLSPNVIEIESKKVIVIYIPESSQVHYTAGKIYDRNEDGDFDITNQSDQVTQLFLRKQSTYTENQVFPYVELSDFKASLFDRVRALAKNQRANHPWAELSNKELLKSAGLYKKDFQTGKSGYTLAAVLLFGTEQLIQSVLPHHRTDAIQRIINLDRYDDRDDIRVNLIDSYDRLMNFVSKHLPDKFHLDGDQRISLRDNLFREIIGNLLIHREFTNGFPAKLIIGKNSVTTENWNKPHGSGNIDPNNFSPHPKNPMIAKFFKQIGWVDELGSGVRNTYKFCKLYTPNSTPEFIEGDIFKAIIPVSQTIEITEQENKGVIEGVIEGVTEGVSEGVKEKLVELLTLLINEEGKRKPHYAEILNESEKNLERYFKILSSFIEFKGAPKTGGYYLTELLKEKLN